MPLSKNFSSATQDTLYPLGVDDCQLGKLKMVASSLLLSPPAAKVVSKRLCQIPEKCHLSPSLMDSGNVQPNDYPGNQISQLRTKGFCSHKQKVSPSWWYAATYATMTRGLATTQQPHWLLT